MKRLCWLPTVCHSAAIVVSAFASSSACNSAMAFSFDCVDGSCSRRRVELGCCRHEQKNLRCLRFHRWYQPRKSVLQIHGQMRMVQFSCPPSPPQPFADASRDTLRNFCDQFRSALTPFLAVTASTIGPVAPEVMEFNIAKNLMTSTVTASLT